MTGNNNAESGDQLLIDAVEAGKVYELRELLRKVDSQLVLITTKNNWPLLFLAKNIEVLRTLLEFGANPNARGPDSYHILHFSSSKHIDEVALLFDHGADVNAETRYGVTPLISAVQSMDALLVQYFIDCGANIEHAEYDLGMTPLHQAVFIDMGLEVPEILLIEGASPNSRAKDGKTPLIYAAFHSPRLVKLLLRFGAAPAIRDDSGMSAADRALCVNREDIAAIIESRNGDAARANQR